MHIKSQANLELIAVIGLILAGSGAIIDVILPTTTSTSLPSGSTTTTTTLVITTTTSTSTSTTSTSTITVIADCSNFEGQCEGYSLVGNAVNNIDLFVNQTQYGNNMECSTTCTCPFGSFVIGLRSSGYMELFYDYLVSCEGKIYKREWTDEWISCSSGLQAITLRFVTDESVNGTDGYTGVTVDEIECSEVTTTTSTSTTSSSTSTTTTSSSTSSSTSTTTTSSSTSTTTTSSSTSSSTSTTTTSSSTTTSSTSTTTTTTTSMPVCGTYSYATPVGAVASSEFGAYTASKAIDGSTAPADSWFSSGPGTQWIYFDIGSIQCISAIATSYYSATYVPITMDIQVSDDAVSWSTVSTWTATAPNPWQVASFTPTTGRYIRLYQTAHQGYGQCTEVQVWTDLVTTTTSTSSSTTTSICGGYGCP